MDIKKEIKKEKEKLLEIEKEKQKLLEKEKEIEKLKEIKKRNTVRLLKCWKNRNQYLAK